MSHKSESPLSRRTVMKSLLAAPLVLQPLWGQANKGPGSSACCQGNFKPNDLFAAKSINGDWQRAQHGDLAATIRMGFAYYTGMAGMVDIPRARSYFLVASHAAPAAAAWLGYLDAAAHVKPGAAVRNWKSFQGLVSASAAGDPVAMTLLGRVYERGLAGYKPRPDKALPLYISAAPDFALAKTYWGRLLLKSGGNQQAISLFQDAAKAGETTAMISLADLYSRMKSPAARKTGQLKQWLRKASKQGDPVALYLLGVQYQRGTLGFTANPQRGLSLLHQSASLGNNQAQNALATAYANGAGGASSAQLARFWARKASLPSLNKPGPPPRPGQGRSATAG